MSSVEQDAQATLFDTEAVQPVINDQDRRLKHLAQAAIWLLKSKGEQTVPFFVRVDPDHPPEQTAINTQLLLLAKGTMAEAEKIRRAKRQKAKKEVAKAAMLTELTESNLISQTSGKRTLDLMLDSFEQRFDRHFTELVFDESKSIEDKEREIKERLPVILSLPK